MVGAYKPIAEFVKLSRKLKFNPTFVNISFVGSKALAAELGENGEGVIISQVVPFPWDDTVPVVKQYQAALKAVAVHVQGQDRAELIQAFRRVIRLNDQLVDS